MSKPKVFVIMPFEDSFYESYEMMSTHFKDSFEFSNAAEEDNQQNILGDIIKPICDADVIIADLTGLNPNVMYELGVAHSLNKKTIVITRDSLDTLPFDLKQYRTKGYSTHFRVFNELLEYLDKNLNGAIDGTVVFNNPVYDFLDSDRYPIEKVLNNNSVEITIPNSEKGYLDFLADIEDETEKMNESINSIGADLNDMNSGVVQCTNEINRVNEKGGGTGTASFVRKQTKKVASVISQFTERFSVNKAQMFSSWQVIETNTYGLLDNPFSLSEDNINYLNDYVDSLSELQEAIITSNKSIEEMKQEMWKVSGIEKNLTQSIKTLDQDLDNYLDMTSQIVSSIDRIKRKHQTIVEK